MRIGRVLLTAAVAALMVSGVANAAGNAWFELVGTAPEGVVATGGVGQTLIIDKGQDPVVLNIGFFLNTGGENIFGWAMGTHATPGATYNVYEPASWAGGDAAGYNAHIGPAGLGLAGLDHAGTTAAAAPAAGLMFEFELIIDKPFLGITEIYAFVGGNAIATETGYGWMGAWGPNAPIEGYPYTDAGTLPMIIINNIPEPATIALLGLGAVALIRRRR